MEKLFDGHLKIICLVTVKMLFIFGFVKFAAIFILDKLKIFSKELQNINQISKTYVTAFAGYVQNILEIATTPNRILKTFPFYYKLNTALREYKEKR